MPTDKQIDKVLDKIFAAISPTAIAEKVSLNYQKARESYVPLHEKPNDYEEAEEEIERFAAHLECCMYPGLKPKSVRAIAYKRVHEILRQAFADVGGAMGAFHIAIKGTKGGLKTVFDRITQAAMSQMERAWAEYMIDDIAGETGLEPGKDLFALMSRYQERFPDLLSEYHRTSSPEYLVTFGHIYDIFLSHVGVSDKLGHATKTRRKK